MFNTRPAIICRHQDAEAEKIGKLYRSGTANYITAGERLSAMKASVGEGNWLRWLEANRNALGFGERTARRLMMWAKNPDLEPGDVWGHEHRTPASDGAEPGPAEPQEPEPEETRLGDDDPEPEGVETDRQQPAKKRKYRYQYRLTAAQRRDKQRRDEIAEANARARFMDHLRVVDAEQPESIAEDIKDLGLTIDDELAQIVRRIADAWKKLADDLTKRVERETNGAARPDAGNAT